MQFNIDELKNKNKAAIISAVSAKLNAMTEKQMIEELTSIDRIADPLVIAQNGNGELKTRHQVERDVLGEEIGSQKMEWSYYPTGEVDEITTIDYDAKGKETKRTVIKHYLDGRQPIATVIEAKEKVKDA